MTISHAYAMLCAVVIMAAGAGCSGATGLKNQSNTELTFYGKVVDQEGKPLGGAIFEFRVEAYPGGWTFDSRGRDNDVSKVTAVSDAQGWFQFELTGCQLIRMKAERSGYRHLCELDVGRSAGGDNFGYRLIAWSDPWYKSDLEHPAVFVFVKDGVHEVSTLPCKGGYDSGGGSRWRLNNPGWPKEPSLKDVVYVGPKPDFQRVVVPKPSADDPKASDMVFYGLVVDQTGKPLKGAALNVEVEQIPPPSWKLRPGDKLTVVAQTHVESGPDGRFEVSATGRNIRIEQRGPYRLAGYSELYDQDGSSPGQNISYSLDPTSLPRYRSEPDHPAVFVLVKLGVNEVSVLPSRGGYDSADGKTWVPNQPTRPRVPSLRWVQKYPTTAPK